MGVAASATANLCKNWRLKMQLRQNFEFKNSIKSDTKRNTQFLIRSTVAAALKCGAALTFGQRRVKLLSWAQWMTPLGLATALPFFYCRLWKLSLAKTGLCSRNRCSHHSAHYVAEVERNLKHLLLLDLVQLFSLNHCKNQSFRLKSTIGPLPMTWDFC